MTAGSRKPPVDTVGSPALEAEHALLRRVVAGLRLHFVALADNRQLVATNPSMPLAADEVPVLTRVIRGG